MESESGMSSMQLLIKTAEEFRNLLLDVNRKIRLLSKSEPYAENFTPIRSVPGVALITGMTFLTETEDIGRFGNTDRPAACIGLIPSCNSSGEKENDGEITPAVINL
jgi:transposase